VTHAAGDVVTVAHQHESKAQFYWVWIVLLALTVVEIILAYKQIFQPSTMLGVLMVLSIIKSALIIGYFMHLKFESSRMKWALMMAVIFCLWMMLVFFPDAFRILGQEHRAMVFLIFALAAVILFIPMLWSILRPGTDDSLERRQSH
jgi:caa(3)-type oxidase subunit IV